MNSELGYKIVFSLAIIISTAIYSEAQTSKRIEFAKGKSSASIRGNTGNHGTTYVVRARSGQKIMLDLNPASKVGIKVETDGRYGQQVLLREERGGKFTVGLEETGDYTIFVGSLNGKTVAFTLIVAIGKMTDI